ncbi:MAG: hypothetical protein ACXVP0_03080 [Bacteroidia bacterium]
MAAILPKDSIGANVVLYVPAANTSQISSLQAEFAKYPQIQGAVYVSTHKCILIEMADVIKPDFYTYGQLTKVIAQYINYSDIKIKTPTAYAEIKGSLDSSGITIK